MNKQEPANKQVSSFQMISEDPQIQQWLFQSINPYIKGKVLEIGSGNGNMSKLFAHAGIALRISDPTGKHCQLLQNRFEGDPMIKRIHRIDLRHRQFEKKYERFLGKFDTIYSINSITLDFNNADIWNNAKSLLWDRGRLIWLLPSPIALYEQSDDGLEEWRQWNRRHVKALLGRRSEILKIDFFYIGDYSPFFGSLYFQEVPFFKVKAAGPLYQKGFYMVVIARILGPQHAHQKA